MKITKERWNQAQIAEYYELNENTDPGENAYAYAVKATFDLLDLNPKVDLKDKVVVEVGTGFYPALLWAEGLKKSIAVDPLFNNWPAHYKKKCIDCGIEIVTDPYEEYEVGEVDETWFFNVLQHVISPEVQLKKAMETSKVVRVFEPINYPEELAHPHVLTEELFTSILGENFGTKYVGGSIENFHTSDCYYGTWVK